VVRVDRHAASLKLVAVTPLEAPALDSFANEIAACCRGDDVRHGGLTRLGRQRHPLLTAADLPDISMAKAKAATVLVKLLSTAGTGYFYVLKKNPRVLTQKLAFMKYDPRVRRHVLFTETKLK